MGLPIFINTANEYRNYYKIYIVQKCKFWPLLCKGRLKCIKMQEKALHFSKFSPGENPWTPHSRALFDSKKKNITWAPKSWSCYGTKRRCSENKICYFAKAGCRLHYMGSKLGFSENH